MKFLIFIPFFIFSQTPDYPDTLYLKSSKVYPCTILQIKESNIIFKYDQGKEITIFLTALDNIFLKPIGKIETNETFDNKDLLQFQQIMEE